jgi:hypothetical protein
MSLESCENHSDCIVVYYHTGYKNFKCPVCEKEEVLEDKIHDLENKLEEAENE